MEDRPVYAFIPKNVSVTGGFLAGPVDTRRVIEGLIGAGIGILLYKVLIQYIHSPMLIYVCGIIGVLLMAAGFIGGNGEPLSIFIFNYINYENRRYFVTLRPPMPDFKQKEDKAKEGSSLENRLLAMKRKKAK